MSKINDGGPAFPLKEPVSSDAAGMTLRDWFAGQALAGVGDWTPLGEDGLPPDWTNMEAIRRRKAEWAYAQADAMLAARERRS